MNSFAHAFRFLGDDPYFIAGTCIPDWLTLVDRKVRVRQRLAQRFADQAEEAEAEQFGQGVVQHHRDDHWFHENPCFVQLNLELAIELREQLGKDAGFRPHLSAHILIEILLDRALSYRLPNGLETFYSIVGTLNPARIENFVNRIAARPTTKIAMFIPRFLEERYLFDYLTDQGIQYRLNRVLQRVKLAPLPDFFLNWLPSAWERVDQLQNELLSGFEPGSADSRG